MSYTQPNNGAWSVGNLVIRSSLALIFCSFAADPVSAECFELWNSAGTLIYADSVPPFDIGYPDISAKAAASKARGEQLVVTSEQCSRYIGSRRPASVEN